VTRFSEANTPKRSEPGDRQAGSDIARTWLAGDIYGTNLSLADADIVQDLPMQLTSEEEERSLKRKVPPSKSIL
jgi:hypothetical protein